MQHERSRRNIAGACGSIRRRLERSLSRSKQKTLTVMPQFLNHVPVAGGPGAGKTTLLAELAARGYATVEESARAIIRERLARSASRRPEGLAFAEEICVETLKVPQSASHFQMGLL